MKKWVIYLIVLSLLASIIGVTWFLVTFPTVGETTPSNEENNRESQNSSDIDILIDVSGNTFEEILEKIEDLPVTGKIFSPGPLGFAISAGYRPPGKEIGVDIRGHIGDEYGSITFYVYVIKLWPNPQHLLAEKIYNSSSFSFSYNLPKDENVTYGIFVIAYNGKEIIDSLASIVQVPPQKYSVSVTLNKVSFNSNDTLILTIINDGPTELLTGYFYKIYKLIDGEWIEIPYPEGAPRFFPDVGISILPNSSWSQTITFFNMEPGVYKIVKEVDVIGTEYRIEVEAIFSVTG